VFNVLGQKVDNLVNIKKPAGEYTVRWNATGFPSGVYYYKLATNNFIDVKKMLLVR